jgi:hypothetical protein
MLVFDNPFCSSESETWTISLPCGERHAFGVRQDAVRFAAREASRLKSMKGLDTYLSLEGEDGKWRLLGPDLKAPQA